VTLFQKYGADALAVVVTGQYTNEEYTSLFELLNELKAKNVYHWQNNPEKVNEFDGLLLRGDKNPNTAGLMAAMKSGGYSGKWEELQGGLNSGKFKVVLVLGPENPAVYPDLKEKAQLLGKAEAIIWCSAAHTSEVDAIGAETWQIPMKTYIEKEGSFTNHAGKVQSFKIGTTVVENALNVQETVELFVGREIDWSHRPLAFGGGKKNRFTGLRGNL